jgi:hypothetical protein
LSISVEVRRNTFWAINAGTFVLTEFTFGAYICKFKIYISFRVKI